MDDEIWNLDDMTVSDLFGVGPADGHDACHDTAAERCNAVTRALEGNVEPCIGGDGLVVTRWVLVAEYEDRGGERMVRVHRSSGSRVDAMGLLEIGRERA